jgi:hypothetical protein
MGIQKYFIHNKSRQAYNVHVHTNILNVEMTPLRYAKNHGRCGINKSTEVYKKHA